MVFLRRLFICSFFLLLSGNSMAQEDKSTFEIYGFVMTDAGYNFTAIDPAWFDVMRPTKLPSRPNQFGPDGNVFFSVRQTRLGFRSSKPTRLGTLRTQFDFDLIGFGADAGQTTLHAINAYGQLGRFIAGLTPSPFMDLDVFPVTLDYWGPASRSFFLNIQLQYIFIQNEKHYLTIALERPGGTADGGAYARQIELEGVKPVFKVPNVTGNYRHRWGWGYVQTGGVTKSIKWKDTGDSSAFDLSGSAFGWGVNLSTVIRAGNNITFKMQGVTGKGIQNYTADAGVDVGLQSNFQDAGKPVKGVALPIWGFFSFAEIDWGKTLKSSVGYCQETIQNSDLQPTNAFRKAQYALVNLRYYPYTNMMLGVEYQYGRRYNFKDGFHATGSKIQVSCKLNFSEKFTAGP